MSTSNLETQMFEKSKEMRPFIDQSTVCFIDSNLSNIDFLQKHLIFLST